jgi:arylsulfatase A-like enzyme
MENDRRYGMNRKQQKQALAGYYASVSFMDDQVGKLLAALERLKLRRNTVVIFAADHGYNLGEHNCWQKLSLFEESARVPLVISAPGFDASAGKRCRALVELVDLYPTIADLAGLVDRSPKNLQGASLRPLLQDPARAGKRQAAFTITHQKGESIRTDRWRYNHWGDEGEELYDHERDPQEFTNLAGNSEHADVLKHMRQLLRTTRERSSR